MNHRSDEHDFQCPGEPGKISRAVHLARLADGYPLCGECPHREDVAGLSERSRKRIRSAGSPRELNDFLHPHGVQGCLHQGFEPRVAGRFAAGFGLLLRDGAEMAKQYPSVAVASDGRPVVQRHLAECVEQLRWAGCHVIELGSVPCPALPWSIEELEVDGGLYLGNPAENAHTAGVRFFGGKGEPITGLTSLRPICARAEGTLNRPVRVSGEATRADAMSLYESRFADSFHGLRPLRFLLHTTCRPAGVCLKRLLAETACRMTLQESDRGIPGKSLPESGGHFAAAIDDDGRRCRLWDERGIPVPFEKLLLLLVRIICGDEPSGRGVVVEDGLSQTLLSAPKQSGLIVRDCGSLPSDVYTAMVGSGAVLGADSTGHIWYGEPGGRVIADALGTLTLVLGKLSDGDRPFSEVLDEETAGF